MPLARTAGDLATFPFGPRLGALSGLRGRVVLVRPYEGAKGALFFTVMKYSAPFTLTQ